MLFSEIPFQIRVHLQRSLFLLLPWVMGFLYQKITYLNLKVFITTFPSTFIWCEQLFMGLILLQVFNYFLFFKWLILKIRLWVCWNLTGRNRSTDWENALKRKRGKESQGARSLGLLTELSDRLGLLIVALFFSCGWLLWRQKITFSHQSPVWHPFVNAISLFQQRLRRPQQFLWPFFCSCWRSCCHFSQNQRKTTSFPISDFSFSPDSIQNKLDPCADLKLTSNSLHCSI